MKKVIYGVVCAIAAICAVLVGNHMDTNERNLNTCTRQKNGVEHMIFREWNHEVAGRNK